MHPDNASAVSAATKDIGNARESRTGACPLSRDRPVLHPLWLTEGNLFVARLAPMSGDYSRE
jgi:hypothetical protein